MASLYKYEFDRLGNNPTNRVIEEPRSITLSDPKAIYVQNGLFYTEGFTVTDAANTPLDLGSDYEFIADDPFVTAETGLGTAAGIRFTDDNFVGDVLISYQAVGGSEGQSSEFARRLTQAIEDAISDPTVTWASIKNKLIFYPPALHRHPPSQLDDLGLLSQRLDEVSLALRDRRPLHDSYHNVNENYERLLRIVAGVQNSINQIVAVTGSAQQVAELQEKVNNVHKVVTSTFTATGGLPLELWSAPEGSFTFLSGTIALVSANKVQILNIDIASSANSEIEWSAYGNYDINSSGMFTLSVSKSGGRVRLTATPAETGDFKVKWAVEL